MLLFFFFQLFLLNSSTHEWQLQQLRYTGETLFFKKLRIHLGSDHQTIWHIFFSSHWAHICPQLIASANFVCINTKRSNFIHPNNLDTNDYRTLHGRERLQYFVHLHSIFAICRKEAVLIGGEHFHGLFLDKLCTLISMFFMLSFVTFEN